MTAEQILSELKKLENPANIEGMRRYGITAENTFGVTMPVLKDTAKKLKYSHKLACELWDTKIREARIISFLIDNPKEVTEKQMEKMVKEFNSWDICDGCCSNLFRKTPFAYKKAVQWSKRKEEFVKRAGFVMIAVLAVHDKKADDSMFVKIFPLLEKEARDERNFVKKAINWALRQIGKRNPELRKEAIKLAEKISKQDYPSSKWIASDAIRELKRDKG
jgi:3-methyladenine DNA glycosylase AlkD